MRIGLRVCALLAGVAVTQQVFAAPLTDRQEDVAAAGDKLQYAVPLAALALTFVLNAAPRSGRFGLSSRDLFHLNGSPRHDLVLALGRTVISTELPKLAV